MLIETDGRAGRHRERRGGSGGKEEVRRLPTIGADVTSTEREPTRMQLFDHPSGRPSPRSPPFASPRRHLIFQSGVQEKSVNRVFGTGFDKIRSVGFAGLVILGNMR